MTRYNKLKRTAASSLSELASCCAPKDFFTTVQAVPDLHNDSEVEVLSDESDHSSDNLSKPPVSSQSQSQSWSQSQTQPQTQPQTQISAQTQSKSRRQGQPQPQSQVQSRFTKKLAKKYQRADSLTSSEEPQDILYILNIKVFFEASLVYENTNTQTISGVQQVFLSDWSSKIDTKTKRWADDKGWSCHWIEIKATVTWSIMKAVERQASTFEESFQPVQQILEH